MSGAARMELEGRWFEVPSPVLAISADDRLAVAYFAGDT